MPEPQTSPIERALASLSSSDLLAFLRRQRWFGAKSGTATSARLATFAVVPWGDGAFAIARAAVDTSSGARIYQLPLAARGTRPATVPDTAVVATIEESGGRLVVYDAVYDDAFRGGLAPALIAGRTFGGTDRSRWIIEPIGARPPALPRDVPTSLSAAEQSNSSIVIGDWAILKLFRTLESGVHPDLEVTRFLTTRAGFTNTPALLAALRFDDEGVATTAGMAQAYLPGSVDAWSYALERGRSYFGAPADRDAPNTFAADANRLGAVTRAMHEALTSDDDDPDFAPEPTLPDDLDRWAHRTHQSIRESLGLLERQLESPAFLTDRRAEAQALVGRRDHYIGWINEIADNLGDDLGLRTRVHGDYHLGQVLRTSAGEFMVIDFEGEPSRPLEDRREKTSPLRDVAGMLRSFAYAAATLAMNGVRNIPPHLRELRTARWERDVRAAYLAGYLHATDEPTILPEEEQHVRHLIALFETEKAFYELAYELNHRPAWAWIPMRGIAKLFTKS